MTQEEMEEIKKKAEASVEKIAADYKDFNVLVIGYSPLELAIMIGTLLKKNTSNPKGAFAEFREVLDVFMTNKIFEFDCEKQDD